MRRWRGVTLGWLCFWTVAYLYLTAGAPWPEPHEWFYARKVAQLAMILGAAVFAYSVIRSRK